jgi:hypothetical protein
MDNLHTHCRHCNVRKYATFFWKTSNEEAIWNNYADGKIILKPKLRKQGIKRLLGFNWLRTG